LVTTDEKEARHFYNDCENLNLTLISTVPKAVRKIFNHGSVPSQHMDNAGTLSGNFFSATCKE
jgi:hypothetical protein